MKITCESCGSKYTIADAKVQGRKVKVRCKSCKSTILVDGTGPADAAPQSVSGASMPASQGAVARRDTWSVNLSDDDSRDMSTAEVIAGWKSGLVTTDAYAWRDGMDDWKPVLEIPELKQKLLAAKPLQQEDVVSSAQFPGAPAPAEGPDLFGGVHLAGSEVDLAGVHAGPPGGAASKKASGERNESSVLFSLDALSGPAGQAQARPRSVGTVDLFGGMGGSGGNLVANTDLLTAPAKEPPPAARVSVPAMNRAGGQKKSKGGMIAALVGVVVVLAIGGYFMMGGEEEGPSATEIAAQEAAEKAKLKADSAAKEKAKMEAELAKTKEALEKAKEEEEKEEKEEKEQKKEKEEEEKEETPAPSGSSSSSPSSASTSAPASAPAKPAAKPGFSISAAKSALSSAAANSASCKKPGGPTGSGKVQVTFAESGRATSAQVVSGPFGGTPTGSCVASTFRRARVPAFSGGSKTVAKSFRIP